MAEMDDRAQVAAAAAAAVPEAAEAVKASARATWVMAGVIAGLVLMVPGAFLAGWRLGRTFGRLRG